MYRLMIYASNDDPFCPFPTPQKWTDGGVFLPLSTRPFRIFRLICLPRRIGGQNSHDNLPSPPSTGAEITSAYANPQIIDFQIILNLGGLVPFVWS